MYAKTQQEKDIVKSMKKDYKKTRNSTQYQDKRNETIDIILKSNVKYDINLKLNLN
jgi:hypothetical protein